ncbi:MAG: serine protease [Proteobacteria bacterium]|jgi:S1-C subfamily serine protease|nr:serine protease [Pseudomonadota bacterium]
MQFLWVLLTFVTSLCHAVIVPSRTVMPFSAVYSGVRVKSEHVTLSTATLYQNFSEREPSREWEFRGSSKSLNVSHEKFETIRALSDATLRATPGDDAGSFGTAFHIGQGYILTNQHVLSTSRSNTTQCKSLRMQTGDGKDSFDCERVVYCHREMDFCLIKMKSKKPGLFNRNPRQIQTLPRHRLRATRSPDYAGVFAAIGNPAGEGIHYSEGSGLQPYRRNTWLFFAPVHSGNSGGPLINEAGEVVGVVYAQSKYGVNEDGYNMAVPLYRILEELKENIAGSEDLRFFENSLL